MAASVRAAELGGELRERPRQLRRRIELGHRHAVRQRTGRNPIVVRQLEVDRRLQHILGVRSREHFAGLVPIHDDAQLLVRVAQAPAQRDRALRAAQRRHAELRDEHDAVGGIERRERPVVQLMLAIEHREQEVLTQMLDDRGHGARIDLLIRFRPIRRRQHPHSAGGGRQEGVQQLRIDAVDLRDQVAEIVRRIQVELHANVAAAITRSARAGRAPGMVLGETVGEIRRDSARAQAALRAVDRDDFAMLDDACCVRRMSRSTAAARSFGSGGRDEELLDAGAHRAEHDLGLRFRRRSNDGRIALATNLPLERRQLEVGNAVERHESRDRRASAEAARWPGRTSSA